MLGVYICEKELHLVVVDRGLDLVRAGRAISAVISLQSPKKKTPFYAPSLNGAI